MAFPSNPSNGDVWVEGGRQFIFDASLPGWRLIGSVAPSTDMNFHGQRLTHVGMAVNNTDAVNLGQVRSLVGEVNEPILHHQPTNSATWNITHNLNWQYVSVQVIDPAGDTIIPDVQYLTAHSVRLLFSSAVTGTAVIRR